MGFNPYLTTLMSFMQNTEPCRAWVSLHGMREVLFPGYLEELGCGNPLQYSCLESPMDRVDTGGWQAKVCGGTKSGLGLSN